MEPIRPYLAVIRQQIANSTAKLMAFRLSFVLIVFVEVAYAITSYLPVSFLFDHVERLGPWNRTQFFFFVVWIQGLFCMHNGLIAPNFWNFSSEVRTGALDFRLLRPLGSLFDVMTAMSRPASLLMIPVLAAVATCFGIRLGLSTLSWCLMPFIFVLSFLAMVMIELNLSLVALWTSGGEGANFVRMQCQQVQRWPDFMYPQRTRQLFSTAIPLLASGSLAVRFLFDNTRWDGVVWLVLICVFFWLSAGVVWNLGLKRYESASS
jgi:ABC-2 type transport system permease protein